MNKSIQDDIDEKYEQEYYQRKGVLTYGDKAYVEKLQGKLRDVSIFEQFDFLKEDNLEPNLVQSDDWGEPIDFPVEEILDMPVMGEVSNESATTNTDCAGQNEPCKVESTPIGVQSKTGDCKEPDYIEPNNFNLNEVSETHSRKFDRESFCINGNDSDLIDIDDLF